MPIEDKQIYSSSMLDPYYIVGLVDGEGHFGISIARQPKAKKGIQIHLIFHVGQGRRGKDVIYLLKDFFKCGIIKLEKTSKRRSSFYVFQVSSLYDIRKTIIPFFEKYPLVIKAEEFQIWREATVLMSRNEHLTDIGISRLIELKEKLEILNKGSSSLIPFAYKWRGKKFHNLNDFSD
jgi:hypothetical protein